MSKTNKKCNKKTHSDYGIIYREINANKKNDFATSSIFSFDRFIENTQRAREKYIFTLRERENRERKIRHVNPCDFSPLLSSIDIDAPVKMIRRSGENARKNSIALKFRKHGDVNIKKERNFVKHFVKTTEKATLLVSFFFAREILAPSIAPASLDALNINTRELLRELS